MKNLIAWFADNHVAANLLMILIVVGGVVSLPLLRTEVFPVVTPNEISVNKLSVRQISRRSSTKFSRV